MNAETFDFYVDHWMKNILDGLSVADIAHLFRDVVDPAPDEAEIQAHLERRQRRGREDQLTLF